MLVKRRLIADQPSVEQRSSPDQSSLVTSLAGRGTYLHMMDKSVLDELMDAPFTSTMMQDNCGRTVSYRFIYACWAVRV
jgi:hypothetical protein